MIIRYATGALIILACLLNDQRSHAVTILLSYKTSKIETRMFFPYVCQYKKTLEGGITFRHDRKYASAFDSSDLKMSVKVEAEGGGGEGEKTLHFSSLLYATKSID